MAERHLITPEYPPRAGGVSDYTRLVAERLAAAGEEVHVWCPPAGEERKGEAGGANAPGVFVHGECGRFMPSDLRRVGKLLDARPAPRRLLVQYVPHGFGWRSMNVALCVWLWKRAALCGDEVELMVHEPFVAFGEGTRRQDAAAFVHRLMAATVLRAARRVWVSIPAWESCLRPYAFGRRVPFEWLPVPATVPVVEDAGVAASARERYAPGGASLIGHLGTYGRHATGFLTRLAPLLFAGAGERAALLLMGRGSVEAREEIISRHTELAARIHAAGFLPAAELSAHLAACDLLAQPYPDGVSSRRTSAMAGLAHGLAVVTTRGRLTEPLWAESGAVALTPAGDAGTFAEAVRRLLGDEAERARLGAAARALYRERFDVAHTVAALSRAGSERVAAEEFTPAKARA